MTTKGEEPAGARRASTDRRAEPEALPDRVRAWLARQGFPLEARVARTFEERAFAVTPHHYVETGGTPAPREIDVLAVHTRWTMAVRMSFAMFVECKWSKSCPWVVFALPASQPEAAAILEATLANPMGEAVLWLLEGCTEVATAVPFASAATPAYGGCRALSGKDSPKEPDQVYGALQSVATLARAGSGWRDRRAVASAPERDAAFAFPVIVIDAPLFAAKLPDGEDEVEVTEIPRARVRWRGARAGEITHIEIVTANFLPAFVDECRAGLEAAYPYLMLAHSDILEATQTGSRDALRARLKGRKLGPPITVPAILRGLVTQLDQEEPK